MQAGTGKTALAELVCGRARSELLGHVQVVDCAMLAGKQVSAVRSHLNAVLRTAVHCSPAVVLWDGLDRLLQPVSPGGQQGHGDSARSDALAQAFNQAAAAADAGAGPGGGGGRVLHIATLRDREALHPAVAGSGRYSAVVALEPPDAAARVAILKAVARDAGYSAGAGAAVWGVAGSTATEGYVGKDLALLLGRAIHAATVRAAEASSRDAGRGGGGGGDVAQRADGGDGPDESSDDLVPIRRSKDPADPADPADPGVEPDGDGKPQSRSHSHSAPPSPTGSSTGGRGLRGVRVTLADFEVARSGFTPAGLHGVQLQTVATTLDDVGGMPDAKATLLETLLWPSKYPTPIPPSSISALPSPTTIPPPTCMRAPRSMGALDRRPWTLYIRLLLNPPRPMHVFTHAD